MVRMKVCFYQIKYFFKGAPMLPIPQCIALAVVVTTIIVDKLDSKDKRPSDLDL